MTVLRSVTNAPLHPGKHWASHRVSLDINRGHVLGLILTLLLLPLLLLPLLLNGIAPAPRPDESAGEPARAPGFRGLPVTDELSLEDAAKNHEYYRIMTSVCHRRGQDRASAAYAWLFHANSRHSQNGLWSAQMFDLAVDSVEHYFGIAPAVDCHPATGNFHGLDLNGDLRLQTNAMNYVFFSRKVAICRQAGNEVQARSYQFHADAELDKASNGRRPGSAIQAATGDAKAANDRQKIHGC